MSRTFRGGQSKQTARAGRRQRFEPNEEWLNRLTVAELKDLADELGVEYNSKVRKAGLIEALMEVGR